MPGDRVKGYIQVYTGDGKGKTTAALGLAMRAYGAGLNVYIAQFVKGMKYSEQDTFRVLSRHITVKQYGRGCFIKGNPAEEDVKAARAGLKEVREIMLSGKYQVLILDEVNIATYYNLISVDDLLKLIAEKPENMELIITGRKADPRVIEIADLVTEMKEIKHYYQNGVAARPGIEK
ncbi:MAG: cob(I)yrinic acid a,c-diamide adenosyltransferase [Deltaproteobacteria bacterium]|nr:cob(I)yrinic acid a,c-diamide adenosyltransferase [Deltaproteobacteria bacterium]